MGRKICWLSVCVFAGVAFDLHGMDQGEDNPTGVSGIFNGNITTAGSYDPYTGNAIRGAVDDLVVPGSVGAYPLKWTRYFNSKTSVHRTSTGGEWRFSYIHYKHKQNSAGHYYPDGRVLVGAYGVEDFLDNPWPYDHPTIRLADGGKVLFPPHVYAGSESATAIVDPYGLQTTIVTTGTGGNKTTKITEPGGRYLLVHYDSAGDVSSVQAFDGIAGHPAFDSVTYTYTTVNFGGGFSAKVLTDATYADNTAAHYTYTHREYLGACPTQPGTPRGHLDVALLSTCDDVRFSGPMRQIKYTYPNDNGRLGTEVVSEKNLVTDEAVSTL